jgi:type I restriction enzyme S subunit
VSALASTVPWQPCEKPGWPVVQVKHKFNTALGKMLQPQPASEADIEAPYIKSMHVQWHGLSFEDLPCMWASPADIAQLNLQVGDLMVCEGGEVGRGALVLNDPPPFCIFQNALHRVRASDANDVRYLNYCLKQASEAGWFEVLCNRATIAHFTVEKFRELRLHLPSGESQCLIANYLDRETARIDGLIAEKERMLVLLEEKRAALISRVVTRGLDPNALFKPSGQEWLGEIPAHWEIIRIKFVAAALDQGTSPIAANTPAGAGELGVLKLSAVSKGRFKREENKALREAGEDEQAFALRKGDVLITRGNTPELVADVACVPSDEPNLLLPDLIYRLRVQEGRIIPEYLTYLLTTEAARVQIRRDARGSSGSMVKVSQVHVLDWLTPLPPISEQTEIVDYLQLAVERFQSMMREVSSSLSLLSERRAALITATVTGQIEVEGTNMNERGHHGTG